MNGAERDIADRTGPEALDAVASAGDLRLVPPALMAWAVAWIVPEIGAAPGFILGLILLIAAGLAIGTHRRLRSASAWLLVGALIVGSAVSVAMAARVAAIDRGPVAAMTSSRAAAWLELVVTSDPEPIRSATSRVDRVMLHARLERVRSTRVRVPVIVLADAASWRGVVPSSRLRVFGRLASPRHRDGTAAVVSARGRPIVLRGPPAVQRAASSLRAGLHEAVDGLSPAERGLVPGLVVGDTSRMQPELTERFRRAGLTHLTAVSGANLMILVGFLLAVTHAVGLRGRLPPGLALAAMGGFVVLARPQPSVLRAAAMATVVLAAVATGRRRVGLASLCAAVCVLILVDPWLARSYGFALSVLATWGILVLAPRWRDRIAGPQAFDAAVGAARDPGDAADLQPSRFGRRVRALAAGAIAVPAAAQVACLPVVVMLTGQVSLVAVVANLLAAPAVAPTTVLGLLAAVASPLSAALARMVGQLAGYPARWIVAVAETFADLPGAVFPWRSGLPGALTVAAALAAGAVLIRHLCRRPAVLVALSVFVAALVVRPASVSGWPPNGWFVVACDIGQGDALVLKVGDSSAVLVDAGPDPRPVDRCLRDLGVRSLPMVVLTHFHADHVAGLPGVLDGRHVGEIVVSPLDDPPENAVHVRRWAARSGVRVRAAVAGEVWRVGDATVTVLGPRVLLGGGQVDGEGSAANNASIVLLAEVNHTRVLLTGDIEPPAQAALLASGRDRLRADVYKVPHHGSANQDADLLGAVQPRVALISVGAGNDYGQPAPRTVSSLTDHGIMVLRTDEHGDVAVISSSGGPGGRGVLGAVSRGRSP